MLFAILSDKLVVLRDCGFNCATKNEEGRHADGHDNTECWDKNGDVDNSIHKSKQPRRNCWLLQGLPRNAFSRPINLPKCKIEVLDDCIL